MTKAIESDRAHLAERTFIELVRAVTHLSCGVADTLRPYRLKAPQYNVMRILRGAGEAGMPCGEIAGRVITRDPDVTRLLDRLERRGLVLRSRSGSDRRIVMARITTEGLAILGKLDAPMLETHDRQLAHMKKKRMRRLVELAQEVRSAK